MEGVLTSENFPLKEEDIIRLISAFLESRNFHITLDALERESGIVNAKYSEEALVLQQAILDGKWDETMSFIQNLSLSAEDMKFALYFITKQRYTELICIISEIGNGLSEELEKERIKHAEELEIMCPHPTERDEMEKLLSLKRLSDDRDYDMWNHYSSRRKCFADVYLVLQKDNDLNTEMTLTSNRILDLLVKGVLYESCEEYCQRKANLRTENCGELKFTPMLKPVKVVATDLSLYSWILSVPWLTMTATFNKRGLNVEIEKFIKPDLRCNWSESILSSNVRPKRFPYTVLQNKLQNDYNKFWKQKIMTNVLSRNAQILSQAKEKLAETSKFCKKVDEFDKVITSKDKIEQPRKVWPNKLKKAFKLMPSGMKSNSSADFSKDGTINANTSSSQKLKGKTAKEIPITVKLQTKPAKPNTNPIKDANVFSSPTNTCIDSSTNKFEQILEDTTTSDIDCLQTSNTFYSKEKEIKSPVLSKTKESCSKANEGIIDERETLLKYLEAKDQLRESLINILNDDSQNLLGSGSQSYTECAEMDDTSCFVSNEVERDEKRTIDKPLKKDLTSNNKKEQAKLSKQHDTSSTIPFEMHIHDSSEKNDELHQLSASTATGSSSDSGELKQNFVAVTQLEDEQAIRSAEFHPSGKFYAVGSNTKTLRICGYPNCKDIRSDQEPREPVILYKRQKQHKGSIYCMAWNTTGDLLATGSNDKTVKLMKFNSSTFSLEDIGQPLAMHGGTVRDMCFMEDLSNRSNLLISGGAGDNKIHVTDCESVMPFQSLSGHTGQILSLYTWGGVMFVSSSQDKTIRFWDMRTRGCVNLIPARPAGGTGPGSAASTISVDPSGRLLVSGHEDSSCMLYDMKGSRILQTFKPHTAEVKTARLSPKAFYLLTGSYDCKLMLTDLQGDLTQPLSTVRVAEHADKIIQGRWHPQEFTFLSTSADKTATLWALPQT